MGFTRPQTLSASNGVTHYIFFCCADWFGVGICSNSHLNLFLINMRCPKLPSNVSASKGYETKASDSLARHKHVTKKRTNFFAIISIQQPAENWLRSSNAKIGRFAVICCSSSANFFKHAPERSWRRKANCMRLFRLLIVLSVCEVIDSCYLYVFVDLCLQINLVRLLSW